MKNKKSFECYTDEEFEDLPVFVDGLNKVLKKWENIPLNKTEKNIIYEAY